MKAASFLIPLITGVSIGVLAEAAAGGTLGGFFVGIALLGIAGPGIVLSVDRSAMRLIFVGLLLAGVMSCWLWRGARMGIGAGEIVQCVLILMAYMLAVAGLAAALERIVGAVAGAALAGVGGLLWLSWPIWMAPMLTGENREATVGVLVAGHPLFGINGALARHFGPWAQQAVTYRLTNIGDDIAYAMPASAWRAVMVHLAAGGVMWGVSMIGRRSGVSAEKRESSEDSRLHPRDG